MTTATPPRADLREELAALLAGTRARTLELVAPLTDAQLRHQHDPLLSPIVWDLGHVAAFEELWLVEQLVRPVAFGEMPGVYDPFAHPRRERGALALPGRDALVERLDEVRRRTLRALADAAFDGPLAADGYVWRMVAQHEAQHQETILQTIRRMDEPYRPSRRATPPVVPGRRVVAAEMVRVPAGEYAIGTDDRRTAYDNERPRHAVALDAFEIDAHPVTNGAYLHFMESGGYRDRRWWTDEGWAWLHDAGVEAPMYWTRRGTGWRTRGVDGERAVPLDHPVVHVSWHEASAFACWAGKRLPTEAEWEVAAAGAPCREGEANLGQLHFGTVPVGTFPGTSDAGCAGMLGDVWEWTSSAFGPYPGFVAFPYAEYSEVFFGGEYRVLRGGSWATRDLVGRLTFRNWDYPIRRQLFAGFRCARDG